MVKMQSFVITKKTVAIVQFGPATDTSGMRPAEYYQVTIDPEMASSSGDFVRFGKHPGDEIVGWQRTAALTVVEILGEWDGDEPPSMTIGVDELPMTRVVEGDDLM